MFGFTPPATPQPAPRPCPHCQHEEALPLYATVRTAYFRCVRCKQIWSHSADGVPPAPAAAA